ncbi:MAG TPA: acylphosphatase [Isosphaeraceae bacterium]|jgi:acylphosphatase|nr:acylphosphatase [Isosphaeraceae bacterium]
MAIERRRVLYRGRVQGVGFRYTTRELAADFTVSGFVRNLRDGKVEVVVEGENAEIAAFLDAISRQMGVYIQGVESEDLPPGEPPLAGFTIRH